jgi:hypothetical protein
MRPKGRDVVERAMIVVDDLVDNGGYLNPTQANEFIQLIVDRPTIMRDMRKITMPGPQMKINKLGFGSRLLHPAPVSGADANVDGADPNSTTDRGLAVTDYGVPITEHVDLLTSELIAELRIPYDVLEDNIEQDRFEQSVMELIAAQVAIDLEDLVINGNTLSGDPYLATMNGVLQLATRHPLVISPVPEVLDRTPFKQGIIAMPPRYLRNKSEFKFYVSHIVETEIADHMIPRYTTLGDTRLLEDYANRLTLYGIPLSACALMPDTNYLLCNPQNLILGMQRKIQIETDKNISQRVIIIVLTLRMALAIEETRAVVKATGLYSGGTTEDDYVTP